MDQQSSNKLPPNLQRTKILTLLAFYGLIAYFLITSLRVLASPNFTTLVIWIIQICPLLLFLSGLHRNNLRTYAWLTFVCLLYFSHAVLVSFNPDRLYFGLVEVALCCLLFVSLIVFIRQYRNHFQVPL